MTNWALGSLLLCCRCGQMQAASVKGWHDISSVFTDKTTTNEELDSVRSGVTDDQAVSAVTGYGSRSLTHSLIGSL